MKFNFSTSKLLCVLIFFFFLFTQFIDAPWNREGGVIKSDIKGYYAYLPALFINNDLALENTSVYKDQNGSKIWYNKSSEGIRYIKYPIGTSVLYAPFFGLAHVYAGLTHYKQDGFSKPYTFALSLSALFYLIFALFYLRKTLLLYFSDTAVSLTLLVVFLGTNVWNYFTFDAGYSHAYSFSVITIFIYVVIKWLETAKIKYALLAGFSFGLIILIRPVDVAFIFFPLFFFVRSIKGLKERVLFFYENKWSVLLFVLVVFACLVPQLIYFKIISDQWFFYTYTDESFFFSNPRLLEAMFSFRNGWIIYSPLMIFSLFGFFVIKKKAAGLFLPLLIVFGIYTFIITSWWCWWYVGFGNRAFINLYPFLSFLIAAFIAFVLEKKWWWKVILSGVLFAGVSLSIFQTFQFNNGAIHWGYMSKKAYYDSFLRWKPTPLFETYLEIPNDGKVIHGENAILKRITDTVSIYKIDFEKKSISDSAYMTFIQTKMSFEGKRSLFLPEWVEYQLNRKIELKNANRIYVSAWVKNPEEFNLCLASEELQFNTLSGEIVDHKKGWDKIELYSKIPESTKKNTLNFYVWKVKRNNAYIDNINIILTYEKLIE